MQSAKHKSEPANDPWSFVHPLTSEDAAAMTALRSAVAGMKGKLEGITARAPFNGIIERVEAPEGVTFAGRRRRRDIRLVGQAGADPRRKGNPSPARRLV